MGYLSEEISKYYNWKGNKIVFSNGINLHKMALEMWSRLGFSEVDSSVLSRVLKGERLFTHRQLNIFSKILDLTQEQTRSLRVSLVSDLLQRNNISGELLHPKKLLEQLHELSSRNVLINSLRNLRKSGHPTYAIELASFFENIFNTYPNLTKTDKKLIGQVYNEKSRAYGETMGAKTVISFMNPLDNRTISIATELKDKEMLDMAYMNIGGSYYVGKKWKQSSDFLESTYCKVGREMKVEYVRTLLLDYAYQNDSVSFHKIFSKASNFIDSNLKDINNVASLIEAMSRSLVIFGFNKEARKLLQQTKSYELSPFYESQLIRCEVYTYLCEFKKNKNVDVDGLIKIANRLKEPKFQPYKRHRKQIFQAIKQMKQL